MTLAVADDGRLYGAFNFSNTYLRGAVYRVGDDGEVEIVHAFSGSEGSGPTTPLVRGDDGWLYGAAQSGGDENLGVIYKVSTAGEVVVVHSFTAADGVGRPDRALVADGAGGWYGTSVDYDRNDRSALYQLGADGRVTLLDSFIGPNLGKSVAALIRRNDGTLFGETDFSPGGEQSGSLFEYRPGGHLHTVHAFAADTEGTSPGMAMAFGRDGAIYGTLSRNGPGGFGTAWRLGKHGAFSVIHVFDANADKNGGGPYGGLTSNANGYLYGTNAIGGGGDVGVVFSMSTTGTVHPLHRFSLGSPAGGDPFIAPTWRADGTLWGLTSSGGANNAGVAYRIGTKE